MKKTKQPKPKKVDESIVDTQQPEKELTEVFPTPLQSRTNAFWYRVNTPSGSFYITAFATCSSDSQAALRQQYPDASINYLGFSEKIIQVGL